MEAKIKDFSFFVRNLILEKGLNANLVSRETGIKETPLRQILSGKTRHPRVDTVVKLATYFNVPLEDFILDKKL